MAVKTGTRTPVKPAAPASAKKALVAPVSSKPSSSALAKRPLSGEALDKANLNSIIEQDAGAGQENIGAADLAIPRVSILQSGSPQAKKSEGAYIKGAEEGDFYDNVSNSILAKGEDGFLFVPVSYSRSNIEWIPKDDGGGFVANHGDDDSILLQTEKDDKGRMLLKNGHEIVTTAEYYCIVLDKDGANPRQAVISMAKTQLKKARKLNTMITSLMVPRPSRNGKFNPAMFYSVFAATTVPESNDKGNWMGWSIARHGDTLSLDEGESIYLGARQFRDAVGAGKVKVAAPSDLSSGGAGDLGSPDDGATL